MTTTREGTSRQTFADWLRSYSLGALDDRLTAALGDLASEVVLLEKTGTLTLTLKLSEKAGGVVVEHDVKTSHPKTKNGQFFYLTASGELTRRDPAQPQLPGTEDPS